ncbi:MAG: hypothetical protein ACLUE1_05485 [Adlercreutzia equolifaciens]
MLDEARQYAETNRVIPPSNVEVNAWKRRPLNDLAGRYLRARLERGHGCGAVGQYVPHRATSGGAWWTSAASLMRCDAA